MFYTGLHGDCYCAETMEVLDRQEVEDRWDQYLASKTSGSAW